MVLSDRMFQKCEALYVDMCGQTRVQLDYIKIKETDTQPCLRGS